jgi:hypothetical protein
MELLQYIHVPKCAGNSVRKALRDAGASPESGHHTYEHYIKCRKPAQFYIATIRNPWDRMVSCYEYFKLPNQSFEEFLYKHAPKMNLGHKHRDCALLLNTWAAQTHWFTLNGKIGNIIFLRFEHLQEDFDRLCEHLNLKKVKLSHLNATKRKHYHKYYTPKWQNIIRMHHREDITNFHYEF